MQPDGTPSASSRSVPIVFENNSAGFWQMPHAWLGGPRCYAAPYLAHSLIYVTCGCRGRDSADSSGRFVGKSPAPLIDLKTAIRFLRHNRDVLPGDWDRVISVGWSSGGALSALVGLTGNDPSYDSYLEQNGAFMEESDAVYAVQAYCPIVDLTHQDMAYEWCFRADRSVESEGTESKMPAFLCDLSSLLADRYVPYINQLSLKDSMTGCRLSLDQSGRSGSFFEYMIHSLDDAITKFFRYLRDGQISLPYSLEDYLHGNYFRKVPISGTVLPMGQLVMRPPKGVPYQKPVYPMRSIPASPKESWIQWDGDRAHLLDFDSYIRNDCRRIKRCPAFDHLEMDSAENQLFGGVSRNSSHFSSDVMSALTDLSGRYPEETASVLTAYAACMEDPLLQEKLRLMDPAAFMRPHPAASPAKHYRIRVGARDAEASLSIGLVHALQLAASGIGDVDFAYVWERAHCEADYPGEVLDWIDRICMFPEI